MCVISDMKRQECLSSLQSVDSAKHCETSTNGDVSTMTMQPPLKSCRVGVAYLSVAHTGTKPKAKDYSSQNGLTDSLESPPIDSTMSKGEQVNVFSVDEVIVFYRATLCYRGISCHRVSVCLSVTSKYCTETATHRITQTMLHVGTGTVFCRQKSFGNSNEVTPNRCAKCRWGRITSANFHK